MQKEYKKKNEEEKQDRKEAVRVLKRGWDWVEGKGREERVRKEGHACSSSPRAGGREGGKGGWKGGRSRQFTGVEEEKFSRMTLVAHTNTCAHACASTHPHTHAHGRTHVLHTNKQRHTHAHTNTFK